MTGTLLHLMRHGAPVVPGLMLGHRDDPSGLAGVSACMTRARDLALDHVVTSDLARAAEPAKLIAAARGLASHPDPRWREMDFGAWDGVAPGALAPDTLARFWQDPDANPPPGGERWSALVRRVDAALGALPAAPTLVVTHGGAMRAALAALCGFGVAQAWAIDLPYAALLSLRRFEDGTAQIVGLAA